MIITKIEIGEDGYHMSGPCSGDIFDPRKPHVHTSVKSTLAIPARYLILHTEDGRKFKSFIPVEEIF